MVAFGGPTLSTLYITSIGGGGSHPADPNEGAGGLFAIETGYRGLPEPAFAGSFGA
jgi:sugar lactone lactonase YvrE